MNALYQFMRSIDIEYLSLGGGKSNFKKLPALLKKAAYFSEEYKAYMDVLIKDGKRLDCNPSELEMDDNDISYEKIEW